MGIAYATKLLKTRQGSKSPVTLALRPALYKGLDHKSIMSYITRIIILYICPLYCRHGNHNILSCLIEGIGRYSGTAIIGPKLEFSDGMVQTGCGREMSVCEVILDLLLPGRVKSKLFKSDMHGKLAREVDWVSGACMLGKRQVLQDLGGFDENIFMYSADVDLCLRVRRQGNKVLYDPTATVIHDGGKSQKKNRSIALRANIASRIYFGKKYYSHFNYFILLVFIAIYLAARFLIHLLLSWTGSAQRAQLEAYWRVSKAFFSGEIQR